ncbi:hypothetical protein ACSBR2_031518 [Camellia fascicularis]
MDTRSSAFANKKFGGHDTVANHEYEAFLDGRTWNVSLSSDNVFEVHCFPSVMVDLGLRTRSCRK